MLSTLASRAVPEPLCMVAFLSSDGPPIVPFAAWLTSSERNGLVARGPVGVREQDAALQVIARQVTARARERDSGVTDDFVCWSANHDSDWIEGFQAALPRRRSSATGRRVAGPGPYDDWLGPLQDE